MTAASTPFEGPEFRAVFEGAPDASIIVDPDGRIVAANDEAERLFGVDRKTLIGLAVERLVPEESRARHGELRGAYTEDPVKRPMGMGRELHARRADGHLVPVEIGLSPVVVEHGRYILAVIHDITERRRLRAFGSGVLQGAEEERQRIARELHDETAQNLAALVLRLQMARRTDDPADRDRHLRQLHEDMLRASEGVRRILRGLRPPLLEESGLVPALRAHARSVIGTGDLEISFEAVDVDHHLTSDERLALYRIVQEALSNIVRHAKATGVRVRIAEEVGMIAVDVEDDGVGFDPQGPEPSAGRGLGLLGLMERAAIIGGVARVESAPGEGTRIAVRIPIRDG
ncbi:MAG: PAS domain-containing sensor histidine kinase [Gemmatimonadota bacterium]|nr:PAS domain-containing sensor histidine kinase [Gemmatimonadota bacterium]